MSDGEKATRAALKRELRRAARDFADQLVALLDRHGVWDETKVERPVDDDSKRTRRSADTLDQVKEHIVAELATRGEATSIGAVASVLGLASRQITHPMGLLVAEGVVVRHGVRRGARYELAAPAPRKKAPKKKKAARRRG